MSMTTWWKTQQDWWRERDREVRAWPMSTSGKWRFALGLVAVLSLQALVDLDRSVAAHMGHVALFSTRPRRALWGVLVLFFWAGMVAATIQPASSAKPSPPQPTGPANAPYSPPSYPIPMFSTPSTVPTMAPIITFPPTKTPEQRDLERRVCEVEARQKGQDPGLTCALLPR